jgi:hypothetical protein
VSSHGKEHQRGEPHGGKGTTKYPNLHQWHEAYQLKKEEVDLIIIVVVQVGAVKYMWQ